ncbi:MAG: DUF4126 domain-containing protein [Janthinobacterium lividum]
MDKILFLGVVTGMRTMTGIAAVCWGAWLMWLPEHGWAMWSTYLVSAIIFTVLAIGEYIGDTLPKTPSRKTVGPAMARLVFGGLVGALGAMAIVEPLAGGILAGVIGAAIGTWGGYAVRAWGAKRVGNDLPVALLESAFALVLAILCVWSLHQGILVDQRRGVV